MVGSEVGNDGAGVVGSSDGVGVVGDGVHPVGVHVATNPSRATLLSDVNHTCMLPKLAITALGRPLPLKAPTIGALLLVPL